MKAFHHKTTVRAEWVDYNGHMNDAAYAAIFSESVDAWMDYIGLDEQQRDDHSYTIFTLETHLCYLQEAKQGDPLHVTIQLLDLDKKRMHVFFSMNNKDDETIATSEQMLMGINTETNRPDAFPSFVIETLENIYKEHKQLETPSRSGRTIGIRRK
ncbi:thioesterase family protein [Salimicrobium flavidum]|uniref:Acyl-CoA thioester hydrolase n=1 Tax=Salimicrobium flavidum TaxID=570947 RepID=A0A1N7JIK5_9BACI|nr:thioesterase family protein [Salimicrobium flavidum]SIS49173.1 acyl-CoA thioester hydrolase [Salimicrobium flavidum]